MGDRPRARRDQLSTLVLGADDLIELVERTGRDRLMDLMIDRLRRRFDEHDPASVLSRRRDGFRYDKPALGLVEWMPTHELGGPVVVKMVGYHPTNPSQRALPSVIATTSMWDSESGHLVALADATVLTAVRTGAASAIATDVLAVDRPIRLGIVGLGAQAVTQLHAISRVRSISSVVAIDADDDIARTFADRVAFTGIDIETAPPERADTIVGEVDVLCTCTSVDIGAGPVVGDRTPTPWLHVNAVGADFPGKFELPISLVQQAFVVPDIAEQCLVEGECQQIPALRHGPELPELVHHADDHAARRAELTVFDSTGWSVEDDVALRLAVELATEYNLGTEFVIECLPPDPYDPYSSADSQHTRGR